MKMTQQKGCANLNTFQNEVSYTCYPERVDSMLGWRLAVQWSLEIDSHTFIKLTTSPPVQNIFSSAQNYGDYCPYFLLTFTCLCVDMSSFCTSSIMLAMTTLLCTSTSPISSVLLFLSPSINELANFSPCFR